MPRLRALHTSPDAPSVDIYIDDSPAVTALSFGQLSNYAEISAGKHNVKLFGSSAGGRGASVLDADINLESGKDYTLAAVGLLANIDAVLMKDSTTMPAETQAKVRVFHASPDAPAVDVGVVGGPTLFKNVSFKQATDFASVDEGTYDLEIRGAGSTESVLSIPSVAVNAGNAFTFVALGLLKGTPSFKVMPIVDRILVAMPTV